MKKYIDLIPFLLFVFLICAFSCPVICSATDESSGASGDDRQDSKLFLICNETRDGEYEIELVLSGESGICAFLGEIGYDESELLFLSCGIGECDLTFSYTDIGGCVRILLDGTENSPEECVLARLYFKRINDGEAELNLSGVGEKHALYFGGDGELNELELELFGCTVADKREHDIKEKKPPMLESLEIKEKEKNAVISFAVNADSECFAAGIKFYIVDIDKGIGESVYVLGVTSNNRFSCEYSFRTEGNFFIIATSVAYDRHGEVKGEKKQIQYINKGERAW